jgi:hypothetical protein
MESPFAGLFLDLGFFAEASTMVYAEHPERPSRSS